MPSYRSYRIILEYTDSTEMNGHPETWDWWDLLDVSPFEALTVHQVEDIALPEAHREELQDEA